MSSATCHHAGEAESPAAVKVSAASANDKEPQLNQTDGKGWSCFSLRTGEVFVASHEFVPAGYVTEITLKQSAVSVNSGATNATCVGLTHYYSNRSYRNIAERPVIY